MSVALRQAKKKMVMLIKSIIEEKRKNKLGCAPRDVVDVLINDASGQLTDNLISDNMIDLMIPAEDSVPVLVTLAVKYLSECPLALQHLEVPIEKPCSLSFSSTTTTTTTNVVSNPDSGMGRGVRVCHRTISAVNG